MKYFVYMVLCKDGTLYTGITTDIARRVQEHNGDKKGGARYTRVRAPVRLVYTESAQDRSSAQTREYAIRKLPRKEKEALIARGPVT